MYRHHENIFRQQQEEQKEQEEEQKRTILEVELDKGLMNQDMQLVIERVLEQSS